MFYRQEQHKNRSPFGGAERVSIGTCQLEFPLLRTAPGVVVLTQSINMRPLTGLKPKHIGLKGYCSIF